jgi:hypothetical protein
VTRPPSIRANGRFVAGHSGSPTTQIAKGEHRSPATEFKPGQAAHNRLPIGSVRVRRETHTGLLRAWVKVAEPNVWKKRAVVVWEAANGPLPRGHVVHHDDRDSLNDDLANLVAMTREAHVAEHRTEIETARRKAS